MGGKERLCAKSLFVCGIFQHGARNAHAVVGRGSAANLVQDQQAFVRRVFDDFRHLGHLHHKGGLPGSEVVRRADARENAVYNADFRIGGRDKAADLRHDDNQGNLAHIGRFARHIGAGDDRNPVLPLVQQHVVRHKGRVQKRLHHRVAALLEQNLPVEIDHRPGIAVVHGDLRKGKQDVEAGHCTRCLLNPVELGGHGLANLVKELVFQLDGAVVRAKDAPLQLLELRRDVALAIGEGLLAYVLRGRLVLIGVGDLDVIAEHAVIADLQFRNPRAFALLGLDLRDDPLPIAHIALELVQLRAVAGFDDAALPDGKRRVLHNGAVDQLQHIVERIQILVNARKHGRLRILQEALQPRQLGCCRRQRPQFPPIGGAVHNPRHQALQIVDSGELLREAAAQNGIPRELLHRIQAAADLRRAEKRLLNPRADQALAHGRAGLIQHPEQGPALFLVPHGFEQFQIPAGIQVQPHKLSAAVELDLRHTLQSCPLGAL